MKDQKQEFLESDISGETTLDVISEANKFNKWMYNTIKPFCKGEILEIGSGIGNISKYFLEDNFKIQLTDIRVGYCNKLQETFGYNSNLLGVECIDLTDELFDTKYSNHFNKYDTVFALNVVEHIHDDSLALRNCKRLLTDGGKLIILVPSYQSLFNQFDIELGHYRRYTKKSLVNVFQKAGIKVVDKQYFNMIGILGWYYSGSIIKRKTIPKGQMSVYNTLVPIFKIIDKITFNSIGLSTIVVGKK
jgi:2-polyprenyl-3-methyl-5-hydroxy-6-metoxy-1,4-benzoquinol methylase